LLLPFHHLGLVEHVGVVHLLVGDGDIGSDEGGLVVVETFTERGKVLVAVPLCEVGILEFLLCLYVERAPSR
jgi:hypothetical protein